MAVNPYAGSHRRKFFLPQESASRTSPKSSIPPSADGFPRLMNQRMPAPQGSLLQVMDAVPADLWDDVVGKSAGATFFHTRTWARLLERTYPEMKISAKAFRFASESDPAASFWHILPMMESGRDVKDLFASFVSNEPGVYGGPVGTGVLSLNQIELLLEYLEGLRSIQVELFGNPYAPLSLRRNGWTAEPRFTHVFDLDGFSTEEELLQIYQRYIRNSVKKASSSGISVGKAKAWEDYAAYFHIYEKSLARWSKNATGRYGIDLFKNIFEENSPQTALWVVRLNGVVAGGVLSFTHQAHFVAWHAAFDEEAMDLGIAKYAHHRVLLEAKERGFHQYDFNPSGGHEGTANFKDKFGARRVPFDGYRWDGHWMYGAAKSVRKFLGR
jgi:hypothetical protein